MYFLRRHLVLTVDINEASFESLWIMILMTSVYVLLPLPFLSIIKEEEMIEQKERYSRDDQDMQGLIEKEYERKRVL